MLYVLLYSILCKVYETSACEYNCFSKLYSVKEEYEVDYNIHANSFNNFKERMQFNVNQFWLLYITMYLISLRRVVVEIKIFKNWSFWTVFAPPLRPMGYKRPENYTLWVPCSGGSRICRKGVGGSLKKKSVSLMKVPQALGVLVL